LDATIFTKNGDRLLEGDMATSYWPRCCRKTSSKARCRASISRSTASRRSGEAMMRISRPLNPDTRLARKGSHRRTVNEKLGFNETNNAVCRAGQFTGRARCRPQTTRAGRLRLSHKQDPPQSARDRSRTLHQYRSMAVILIPRATTSQLRRRWLRRKDLPAGVPCNSPLAAYPARDAVHPESGLKSWSY
jgi:hypothetical protein